MTNLLCPKNLGLILSSKFFQCSIICLFVLAGASVANAQCNPTISRTAQSWDDLPQAEAHLIYSATRADRSCFNKILSADLEGEIEVDFNAKDANGNTAIMLLALRTNGRSNNFVIDMIKNLLDHSNDLVLTTKNNDGLTVFDLAKQRGPYTENFFDDLVAQHELNFLDNIGSCDVIEVTKALNFGVNPNLKDSDTGKSALMLASEENCLSVVRELLKTDVDVDYQLENGKTALMLSTENALILSVLLNEGNADVNIQDASGKTALMHAIYTGSYIATTRLISSGKIDFALKDNDNNTVISAAKTLENASIVRYMKPYIARALHSAIKEDNVLVVNLIVAQVSKNDNETIDTSDVLNFKDFSGNTPLLTALSSGSSTGIVHTLVSNPNTDLTAKTLDGKTALMLASRVREVANFRKILSADQDVNARDNDGKTALIHAVEAGQLRMASELLSDDRTSAGISDNLGLTALEYARSLGDRSIIFLLERASFIEQGKFFEAVVASNLESFKVYAQGVDINTRDASGETALIKASKGTNISLVNEILSHLNVDVNAKADNGDTALTVATQHGRLLIVTELLKNPETHVDVFGREGKTALIWAILEEKPEIARLLIEHGADVTLKDKETGKNALMLGARNDDYLLLETMASQDNVTEDDLTEAIEVELKENNPNTKSLHSLERAKKIKTSALYRFFNSLFGRKLGVEPKKMAQTSRRHIL